MINLQFRESKVQILRKVYISFALVWVGCLVSSCVPGDNGPAVVTKVLPHLQYFTSQNGIRFVWIPGGTFQSGDPNEIPFHPVTVGGFWMSTFLVTQAQYKALFPDWKEPYPGHSNYPVTDISYDEAVAFASKMQRKFGGFYRLPTDSEWEYAACGGLSEKTWPWGNDSSSASFEANGQFMSDAPCNVGIHAPNGYGLYDVMGNEQQFVLGQAYGNRRTWNAMMRPKSLHNPIFFDRSDKEYPNALRGIDFRALMPMRISWPWGPGDLPIGGGIRLVYTQTPTRFQEIDFKEIPDR